MWTGPSAFDSTSRSRPVGVYHLREEDNLKAQVEALTRQIEALETKDNTGICMVAKVESHDICFVCRGVDHQAQNCPIYSEMRGVYKEQYNTLGAYKKPYAPYFETYNPGWRNHMNFSLRDSN